MSYEKGKDAQYGAQGRRTPRVWTAGGGFDSCGQVAPDIEDMGTRGPGAILAKFASEADIRRHQFGITAWEWDLRVATNLGAIIIKRAPRAWR